MEKKINFPKLALLAMMMFGGILWISQPSSHRGDGVKRYFELNIEADGRYDAQTYDFASVRDTLDNHFNALAAHYPAVHYSWKTLGVEGKPESALRASFSLKFEDAADRLDFLENVLSSELLEVAVHSKDMTGLYGYASGDLPMAGAGTGSFQFQGWKFRMNMVAVMEELG